MLKKLILFKTKAKTPGLQGGLSTQDISYRNPGTVFPYFPREMSADSMYSSKLFFLLMKEASLLPWF